MTQLNATDRRWHATFVVTSIIAIVWLAGTALFLFDAEDTRFVAPVDGFGVEHNCLTGYVTAAHLATEGTKNVYNPSHYRDAQFQTPIHKEVLGTFSVDAYHYPPPFLTLPYVMQKVFGSFFSVRAAWFVLTLVLLLGALVAIVHWCGAFRSQARLLIFPLLLCAPTLHVALQIGNAHILVIAISMLAMVAFEKQRPIAGGALLGFAVAAKIWPGVLVAYLLLQRKWKPALYCVTAVVIYSLGALLLFGVVPYNSFIDYEFPRIASGEAFGFMAILPRAIMTNMSVFGIPHKLHALGLISKPALMVPALSWLFTGLVGLTVVAIGHRHRQDADAGDSDRLTKAQLWLTLLTLVQLRSPFLPWPYGIVSTLWLLILLSASARGWKLGAIFAAWLFLSMNVPLKFISDAAILNLSYTLFASLLVFGSIAVGLRAYWIHNCGNKEHSDTQVSYAGSEND